MTLLRVTDALRFIVGFNAIDGGSEGFSFDEPQDSDDEEVSPYVDVTYELAGFLNLYASYSDIYEPQPEIDATLQPLGAAEGKSYETGVKAELIDGRLLASIALFRAEQDNYAEYAGFDAASGLSYYTGADVESEGYEPSSRANSRTDGPCKRVTRVSISKARTVTTSARSCRGKRSTC